MSESFPKQHRGLSGAHLCSLAPNAAPFQRGLWGPDQEGRSLQPGQGGGLVASGLEPGAALLRFLRTLVSFLVPPSPPLITCAPTGGAEAFSVFLLVTVFVLCCASQWIVCFSMLGKEKNRNASPCYQLCRSSSHLGEFSLGWFGVMSEASWKRSSGCWPLRLAGVFNRGGVGEGMSCWMGPCPPLCGRERGLSCVGFSAGGRRESLNREENKTTPSLSFLSVRS